MLKKSFCFFHIPFPKAFFSNKKLSKIIVNANDYLKDTKFDSQIKTEWEQKEAKLKNAKISKGEFQEKIEDEIEEVKKEFQETESILRSFKKKIQIDEKDNIKSAELKEKNAFLGLTKFHFEGKHEHKEVQARSQIFKENLRLKQDWSPLRHINPHISDQYANYMHYKKSFPEIKDRFNENDEDLRKTYGRNRKEFFEKVDPRSLVKQGQNRENQAAEKIDKFQYETRLINRMEEEKNSNRRLFWGVKSNDDRKLPPISSEFIEPSTKVNTIRWKETEKVDEELPVEIKDLGLPDSNPKEKKWEPRFNDNKDIIDASKKIKKDFDKKLPEINEKEEGENLDDDLEKPETINKTKKKENKENKENEEEEDDPDAENEEEEEDMFLNSQKKRKEKKIIDENFLNNQSPFVDPLINEYDEAIRTISYDDDPTFEFPELRGGLGPLGDSNDKYYNLGGRVSPWAREEIFRLFLQGWPVRDLSVRYGLLPERIKAIVWMKKQFYDEIFHRIDVKTIKLGIEMELLYGFQFGWMDFGLDMERLIEREKGIPQINFAGSGKVVDTKSLEDQERRLKNYLENKKQKKFDIVTQGFVGSDRSGYLLKSKIVYRGHGSERVNRGFKRALHDSERRHRLSKNMLKKVHKGPRYVAMGMGIK